MLTKQEWKPVKGTMFYESRVGDIALIAVLVAGAYIVVKYIIPSISGGLSGLSKGISGIGSGLYQSGYNTGISLQDWLRSIQGLPPLTPVGQLTASQKSEQSLVLQGGSSLSSQLQAQYNQLVNQGFANAAGGTVASPYGGGFFIPQATGKNLTSAQLSAFTKQQQALQQQLQSGAITQAQFNQAMTVLNDQYVTLSAMNNG